MASSPSRSGVTPAEITELQAERIRIKNALFAEHGEKIEQMMKERATTSTMNVTPAQEREERLMAILENRTPLRKQVQSAQIESIDRLVEHAKESAARGEDVKARLEMLLAMQETERRLAAPAH